MEGDEALLGEGNAVAYVALVGLHHRHGNRLEFIFPQLHPEAATGCVDGGAGRPVAHGQESTAAYGQPVAFIPSTEDAPIWGGPPAPLPRVWRHLPFLALGDGAHLADIGHSAFVLPDPRRPCRTLFCAAVSAQVAVNHAQPQEPGDDLRRQHIQKAVIVMTRRPYWAGVLRTLPHVTQVYMAQPDLTDTGCLTLAFFQLSRALPRANAPRSRHMEFILPGLQLHDLVRRFGLRKLLVLCKLLLLEDRLVVYSRHPSVASRILLALLSLFPDMLSPTGVRHQLVADASVCGDAEQETYDSYDLEDKGVEAASTSSASSENDMTVAQRRRACVAGECTWPWTLLSEAAGISTASIRRYTAGDPVTNGNGQREGEQLCSESGVSVPSCAPERDDADASAEPANSCSAPNCGKIDSVDTEVVEQHDELASEPLASAWPAFQHAYAECGLPMVPSVTSRADLTRPQFGFPIPLFEGRYSCYPYLNIMQLDELCLRTESGDGFVAGCSNWIMSDHPSVGIFVNCDERSITFNNRSKHLERACALTPDDVRFLERLSIKIGQQSIAVADGGPRALDIEKDLETCLRGSMCMYLEPLVALCVSFLDIDTRLVDLLGSYGHDWVALWVHTQHFERLARRVDMQAMHRITGRVKTEASSGERTSEQGGPPQDTAEEGGDGDYDRNDEPIDVRGLSVQDASDVASVTPAVETGPAGDGVNADTAAATDAGLSASFDGKPGEGSRVQHPGRGLRSVSTGAMAFFQENWSVATGSQGVKKVQSAFRGVGGLAKLGFRKFVDSVRDKGRMLATGVAEGDDGPEGALGEDGYRGDGEVASEHGAAGEVEVPTQDGAVREDADVHAARNGYDNSGTDDNV